METKVGIRRHQSTGPMDTGPESEDLIAYPYDGSSDVIGRSQPRIRRVMLSLLRRAVGA